MTGDPVFWTVGARRTLSPILARMHRTGVLSLVVLAAASTASAAALPPNVEKVETYAGVDQYRLKSNGMTLVVVPNHASPVFTFLVVYHVGSRNEAPGNTGSAHRALDELREDVANRDRALFVKLVQEIESGLEDSTLESNRI